MEQRGTIYTYTVIYSAAEAFKEKTPYVMALVEGDAGKILTCVDGYQQDLEIKIGQEVALSHMDEHGNRVYKFI